MMSLLRQSFLVVQKGLIITLLLLLPWSKFNGCVAVTAEGGEGERVCKSNDPKTPDELQHLLLLGNHSTYEKSTRPGFALWASKMKQQQQEGGGGAMLPPPDSVKIDVKLNSVMKVNIKGGSFVMMAWLRTKWNDPRLQYSNYTSCFPDNMVLQHHLNDDNKIKSTMKERRRVSAHTGKEKTNILKEIWKPDIYITNQIEPNEVLATNVVIYPNGDVVYARKLKLTLSCLMNVYTFPNEIHLCSLGVGTFLEDENDVVLSHYDNSDKENVTLNNSNSRRKKKNMNMFDDDENENVVAEWDAKLHNKTVVFHEVNNNTMGHSIHSTESYLLIYFALNRVTPDHYDTFVTIPAIMFMIIGYASMYISRHSPSARVFMSTSCFLTTLNFINDSIDPIDDQRFFVGGLFSDGTGMPQAGFEKSQLLQLLFLSSMLTFYPIFEYAICNHLVRVEARIESAKEKAYNAKLKIFNNLNDEKGNSSSNSSGDRVVRMQEEEKWEENYSNSNDSNNSNYSNSTFRINSNNNNNSNYNNSTVVINRNDDRAFSSRQLHPSFFLFLFYNSYSYILTYIIHFLRCHNSGGNNNDSSCSNNNNRNNETTTENNNNTAKIRSPKNNDTKYLSVDKFDNVLNNIMTVSKADMIDYANFDDKIGLLLLNEKGDMMLKDQHIEIFSRYAFPIVIILSIVFIYSVDEQRQKK